MKTSKRKIPELAPDMTPRDPESLVQFNARVPAGVKVAVKSAVYMAGIDLEVAAQDAWKLYFGINDDLLETRRAVCQQAFKKLYPGNKRPFDMPLIPNTDNATLTSRGDSDNLAAPTEDGGRSSVGRAPQWHCSEQTSPAGLKIKLHIPKRRRKL